MFLTANEHEAFLRGQAAGLIPEHIPLPRNEEEINGLILHIGLLFSVRIGYRNRNMKFRVMELTTFSEDYLNALLHRLPQVRKDEVLALTEFRQEVYPSPLEGLYQYFSFGKEIVAAADLNQRLAEHCKIFSEEEILRGFDFPYTPPESAGGATLEQRAELSDMVLDERLPAITRRTWEHLTEAQAAELISSVPNPEAELPDSVKNVLYVVERLSREERELVRDIINQKHTWRKRE